MSKTKIILASTLSVLAVAGVTTAAVVVTMKNKDKQKNNPELGKEQDPTKKIEDGKKNPETDPNKDNTQTQAPETGKNNNNNQTNPQKIVQNKHDFNEINDAIKKEYDKETQIINEYDDNVAKYWEEQTKNDKKTNSIEKPNNQPQSDGSSTNGGTGDGKGNDSSKTKPAVGAETQPNTHNQQKPAPENIKKPTLKVVNSSWEGYEQGNNNKQGYITFTLWSTNEKYDEILKAGSKIKLLLWFDKFDNQEDSAMPITLKTNQGDKTVYTLNPISKDGGKQFQIQTISPFTLNTWGNSQKEVKIKLIGLFINDDKNNNLIDGAQGEPVIINK
ncbi:putative protin, predicted transmembrane protein [Mycoplasmopsis bovigenitalium 51080]|uniref:Putative protin, predicted transmembrane protein n=1 Tax=Mycoplasmopsis bovigenitalium 51080 TaxID=1188235 RepID=N9VF84_9BACT|nr:hypothetical protein [Mycoplasmopsis bovigenitalium]ENY70273.1 putative protin, predicted transmembrane protein [Mycoplasmopsis bovigenitalium 51080]